MNAWLAPDCANAVLRGPEALVTRLARRLFPRRLKFGPRAMSSRKSELAIGYDEEHLPGLYLKCGLEIRHSIA